MASLTINRLIRLERFGWPKPRLTIPEIITQICRHTYGSADHPATLRALAHYTDPDAMLDLRVDGEWANLAHLNPDRIDEAPEDIWPMNGHSLSAGQRYFILCSRIWLFKADPEWPLIPWDDQGRRNFLGRAYWVQEPGESFSDMMRRYFNQAKHDRDPLAGIKAVRAFLPDVEDERDFLNGATEADDDEDNEPELHGPIMLPNGSWPMNWEAAYWLAGTSGDGLYMAREGLGTNDHAIMRTIRARDGLIKSRGFAEQWSIVGQITKIEEQCDGDHNP